MTYSVRVSVQPLEDGPGFLAICDDIPGCHAEGQTITEALEAMKEVVRAMLVVRVEDGRVLDLPAEGGTKLSGRVAIEA